jgi:acetyl-CoA synthetase
MPADTTTLERELDALLTVERFAPPAEFAERKRIVWADELPKTRSGKIMRRLLRDVAEGRELGDVTTLRHPAELADLADRISARDD